MPWPKNPVSAHVPPARINIQPARLPIAAALLAAAPEATQAPRTLSLPELSLRLDELRSHAPAEARPILERSIQQVDHLADPQDG